MKGSETHLIVTAIHEAGHALAALNVGRFVYKVAISYQHPGAGLTISKKSNRNPYNLSTHPKLAWQRTLEDTLNSAFVTITGPCVEAKLLGTPLRSLGCQSDYDRCIAKLNRLPFMATFAEQYGNIEGPDPVQLMNSTRKQARRWVASKNNWRAINRIAKVLYEQGEIDAEGLHQPIGEAKVQTVSPQLNLR